MQITCPRCANNIPIAPGMAGQKLRCPSCTQKLQVPGVAPPPPQSLAPGSKEWFYRRDDASFGPVTVADLKYLAAEDQLSQKDMLWSEGMENWQPAGKVHPRLFTDPGSKEGSGGRLWEGAGVAIYSTLVGVVLLIMAGGLYLLIKNKTDKDKATQASAKDKEDATKTPPKATSLKPVEVFAKCKPAVARVRCTRANTMGSGFLIAPGIVVTNSHVVDGELVEYLEVSFPDGDPKKYRAKLLYEDRKNDLAVLKIDCKTPPLTLAEEPPPKGGQVVVIGSPGANVDGGVIENTPTDGLFGGTSKIDDRDVYLISAPINGGNSGGPVFDDQGRVFGVATLSSPGKQAQNYTMTIGNIRNVLSKASKLEAEYEQTGAEHDLAELYQRLSLVTAYQNASLNVYYNHMNNAQKNKREVSTGILLAKQQRLDLAREYKKRLLDPIEENMTSIVSNRALEKSGLRNNPDILALRELATDAHRTLENPTTDVALMDKYTDYFPAQRIRLVRSLRTKLDVPVADIQYRAVGLQLNKFVDMAKTEW